ncbi:MAG: ferredoxin reductase [Tahibacter sp.]
MRHDQLHHRRSAWRRVLRSRWLHPLNDVGAIEQLLVQVHPALAFNQIRARVVAVIRETGNATSFVLRPNRRFPLFHAGQHLLLNHEIDGVSEQRCYTLSTRPRADRTITITVKTQTSGRVSSRLHDDLKIGTTVRIGGIAGEFVLPDTLPQRILLLSAGSGITPMRALLEELHARAYTGDVVLAHSCRGEHDLIFGAELRALAARWPSLRLIIHDSAQSGRLDHAMLASQLGDFTQWSTWACGPAPLLEWITAAFRVAGREAELHIERFAAHLPATADDGSADATVHCTVSKQVFTATANAPLLIAAENAGLQPKYGCRRGICRSCVCRKRSGSVRNLVTGEVSAQADQWIQLCISSAQSNLDLEL